MKSRGLGFSSLLVPVGHVTLGMAGMFPSLQNDGQMQMSLPALVFSESI